jgi:signal peptidase II
LIRGRSTRSAIRGRSTRSPVHGRSTGSPIRGLSTRSPWIRVALVALAVVALDQLSKSAVRGSIVPGEERGVLPGIELVDTRNHGIAFGLLPGAQLAVAIVVGLALLALLVYFARHAAQPLVWLPTGMLLGGALGNILDRLRRGSVTDFIKLPLGWPPFNLADLSITLGVLLLLLIIERPRHRPSQACTEGPATPGRE